LIFWHLSEREYPSPWASLTNCSETGQGRAFSDQQGNCQKSTASCQNGQR